MNDISWIIETDINGELVAAAVTIDVEKTLRFGSEMDMTFLFYNEESLDDYETFKEYIEFHTDNSVETGETIQGDAWFRELINIRSGIESFLFKITPPDSAEMEPFWCVPTSLSDETSVIGPKARVNTSMTILGTVDEYPTREEVLDEFAAEL